jgi:hypothetical protein
LFAGKHRFRGRLRVAGQQINNKNAAGMKITYDCITLLAVRAKNYAFAAIPVRLLDGSDRQTVYHQWVGETSDHAIA